MSWIPRTKPQTLSATHDLTPQAQRHCCNTVLEAQGRDGIEVSRPHHPCKVRIKPCAMRRAHHLLKDDCHLLLFQAVGRSSYVGLRMPAEGRSVNASYRV